MFLCLSQSQLWDEFELEDATFAECSNSNANNSFQVDFKLCNKSKTELNKTPHVLSSGRPAFVAYSNADREQAETNLF
ncbi:hypothetical protein EVAR_79289_1 [Eumeta japonica]|uniref:Uncharacterized protein n=1 Tax=Eumeta variegata TaxID=151549 RepID=A0A4C1TEH6_EUMVA|nr:hypothetical protein EVAR_79289_1 [Eumeta japonica]